MMVNDDTPRWTLEPSDIEWEMPWEPRDRYPDKPQTETIFEPDGALCHLLMNGVCYVNTFWMETDWPPDAQRAINVFVSCGDTFSYACADAERLPYDEIEPLYRLWRKNPTWGATAWAVMRRKERPILPVETGLRDAGYDVDSWGLRDNTSNAETQAAFAHAAAALHEMTNRR